MEKIVFEPDVFGLADFAFDFGFDFDFDFFFLAFAIIVSLQCGGGSYRLGRGKVGGYYSPRALKRAH